jgi:two-component system, NarL family, sensor kinase
MDTHETKVYIAFLIAAGILGVFLIFFIATVISHQRRNQALHKEKINAEINTLEKERSRIASDLHDDLGPMLSAVKLLINNVDLVSADDKETLSKANDYIDGVLLQLRTISNDLVPQALGRKGLVVAVNEFISERNEKRTMQVRFQPSEDLTIPPSQGIHLYRIIHEVIHNADKHAKATTMLIGLDVRNEKLILSLQDNGCGFDTRDPVTTQKGLGLKNIMSRVETLKGNIYLKSGPGKGTEYTIEIPTWHSHDSA